MSGQIMTLAIAMADHHYLPCKGLPTKKKKLTVTNDPQLLWYNNGYHHEQPPASGPGTATHCRDSDDKDRQTKKASPQLWTVSQEAKHRRLL